MSMSLPGSVSWVSVHLPGPDSIVIPSFLSSCHVHGSPLIYHVRVARHAAVSIYDPGQPTDRQWDHAASCRAQLTWCASEAAASAARSHLQSDPMELMLSSDFALLSQFKYVEIFECVLRRKWGLNGFCFRVFLTEKREKEKIRMLVRQMSCKTLT